MIRTFFPVLLVLTVSAGSPFQDKKPAEKKNLPRVLYFVPLVAKPGEKQKLFLRGKGLASVKEVKVEGDEGAKAKVLAAKAVGVPNNYPAERVGDSEVEIELELSKGVKQGAIKIIAVGPSGPSVPYTLLLRDDLPAVVEKEPNDGFAQAQKVMLPCAVEGAIKSERDVDVYQFAGKRGDAIAVELQARRFGSPLDPILTLYDANHRIVDSADDSTGKPDAALTVTLLRDGTYYLSVMDANDQGGENFGYRLVVRPKK